MVYRKIASEINKMAMEDQKARELASIDTRFVDEKNNKRMKEIIEDIGYPTITKVGKQASFNSWLVIQHSPDLNFQIRCLDLMEKESFDVNPQNIAYLKDRVLMLQEKPQIYGTQLKKNASTGKFELYSVADTLKIDALRKSIGLEPIDEYLKRFE